MTQKCAIARSLLNGDVLSIRDGFERFACTNLPRELSRSIEKSFGVEISRTSVKFKSIFGQTGRYHQYRLNKTPYNQVGIKKMREYIKDNAK